GEGRNASKCGDRGMAPVVAEGGHSHSPAFRFHSSFSSLFRAASTSIGGSSLVAQFRAPCLVMPARRPTSAAVGRPWRISATPISRGVFMNASQSSEVQLSLHLMWLIYSSLVERQEHKIEQNLKFFGRGQMRRADALYLSRGHAAS